ERFQIAVHDPPVDMDVVVLRLTAFVGPAAKAPPEPLPKGAEDRTAFSIVLDGYHSFKGGEGRNWTERTSPYGTSRDGMLQPASRHWQPLAPNGESPLHIAAHGFHAAGPPSHSFSFLLVRNGLIRPADR